MGLAGLVPSDADGRTRQPGDLPPSRDAEPVIPVEYVSIRWVEAAGLRECRASERDRRAAERIAADHRRGQLTRRKDAVGVSESAAPDDVLRHRIAAIVDHHRCARDQPDPFVVGECPRSGTRDGPAP